MAIYHEDIVDIELEGGNIHRAFLNTAIGSGDELANRFGVRAFRNGQPENIGGTCFGLFVRADGATVAIANGTVSGNVAYVTLPEACYAVEGQFTLAIKCQGGGVTGTLRIVDGVVSRTSTDETVDPGNIIESVEDLIDAIDDAVAEIPVNYNASFAPEYSTSAKYNLGDYVTYDGYLWRCTTAITSSESWTSGHWKKIALASDVSEMRRAIGETQYAVRKYSIPLNGEHLRDSDPIYLDIKTGEKFLIKIRQTAGRTWRYYLDYTDGTSLISGWSANDVDQVMTAAKDIYAFRLEAPTAGGTEATEFQTIIVQSPLFDFYTTSVSANQAYITNSNYSTVLPDADNAKKNTVYLLLGNNIQASHLPVSDFSTAGLLANFRSDLMKYQILIQGSKYWVRTGYDSTWNAWTLYKAERQVVRVGATEEYTKLTDALEYAYNTGDCDVYVNSGTYDIFDELGGSSYFDDFEFVDGEKGGGPVVGKNCRYFFSPGAEVTFYNTTSNEDVAKTFSPFNAGNGNFMIDGLVIKCSKCRYAFHDEMTHTGLNNRQTVEHVFRNVNFYKDNSGNTYFVNHMCIGGGLISHGGEVVTIENSFFDGAVAGQPLVSYHNGLGGSSLPSQSKVSITGCYFDNGGTARISSYGDNTDDSVMFVTNCSLGTAPINELETQSSEMNTKLYQWNNVIRT